MPFAPATMSFAKIVRPPVIPQIQRDACHVRAVE
jgi:hypothetical protein